jgi:hypothetical protein
MLKQNGKTLPSSFIHLISLICLAFVGRLIEYATNYFDLSSFPDGETKRALQRVVNKKAGKAPGRVDGGNGDSRDAKKRKKNNR